MKSSTIFSLKMLIIPIMVTAFFSGMATEAIFSTVKEILSSSSSSSIWNDFQLPDGTLASNDRYNEGIARYYEGKAHNSYEGHADFLESRAQRSRALKIMNTADGLELHELMTNLSPKAEHVEMADLVLEYHMMMEEDMVARAMDWELRELNENLHAQPDRMMDDVIEETKRARKELRAFKRAIGIARKRAWRSME